VREQHSTAIVDRFCLVRTYCRYKARPSNRGLHHPRRRKKQTIDIHITNRQKWMVPGEISQCSTSSAEKKEKPCETHTNIVDKDRYTQ
jgi:hypothetical protein